jgi:SAM-dependent methyltransferase
MQKYPDLSSWAVILNEFNNVEIARGFFDKIECLQDALATYGWMFLPGKRIDFIRAYLNGQFAAQTQVVYRPDVEKAISPVEGAGHSGFEFRISYEAGSYGKLGWIDLIGCQGERPISRMSTLFHSDPDSIEPTPPSELMYRVVNNRDSRAFKASGLKSFGDFLRPILRHREIDSLQSLLDWGCGCGRLTMHFLSLPGNLRVHGCDIDGEAVEWCRENLAPGLFSTVQPYPPTPYPDKSFDVIVGLSVFTHLTRKAQRAWLSEMRRLIRPGGLFLASVHGEAVTGDQMPERVAELLRKGILDDTRDATLEGVAPKGYYRGVFQTREYTYREWSRYFEVLEYVVRGVGNRQDLVVMRG